MYRTQSLWLPGAATASQATNGSEQRSIKPLPPAEAAKVMVKGSEKGRYRVLVGRDAKMMGLLYRLSPRRAAGLILNQIKSLLPD
ncbi:MAG: hypothetical protein R3272_04470 [Candidatus Promineifilaceae bacterium]|nr:hypothetical protein [Candidatus Promineifilaceae bacterium]